MFKDLLGPGALTVFLIALWQGTLEIRKIRAGRKTDRDARDEREDERIADWNADYRSYAEAHMPWDQQIQARVYRHEIAINQLQQKAGLDVTPFDPMPPPHPLPPAPPRSEGRLTVATRSWQIWVTVLRLARRRQRALRRRPRLPHLHRQPRAPRHAALRD
jgi:hypothetical protein